MKAHTGRMIGGVLLVSGTTIGAAMLALPVVTGFAGFLPSLVLFLLYWLFMTFTAFLILEVNLWKREEHTNIISMAEFTLGIWGQAISWFTYLFLLYSLTTAYIAGSSPIFLDFLSILLPFSIPSWVGPIPLLVIFGFIVYKGTFHVDQVNRLLMIGLVITYLALIFLLMPHLNTHLLNHIDWKYLNIGVSVVATSFGFHIIIPTLTTYLKRDVADLKRVIWIGSFIPLIVYVIWECFTLAIIPLQGPNGIIEGFKKGSSGAYLLSEILNTPWIITVASFFSFFAIVTSFLGVSLSLSDFLADGFKIKKTRWGRFFLCILTFVPPLAITLTNPRAFLTALEYAGVFGVVILLGILPILMVWSGRYKKHTYSIEPKAFRTPGGKPALLIGMVFFIVIICIEIANKVGLLSNQIGNT